MAIPDIGVHGAYLRREARLGVQPPPLAGEARQRLLSGIEEVELAKPSSAPLLGIERLRVPLPVEVTRTIARALAPAH